MHSEILQFLSIQIWIYVLVCHFPLTFSCTELLGIIWSPPFKNEICMFCEQFALSKWLSTSCLITLKHQLYESYVQHEIANPFNPLRIEKCGYFLPSFTQRQQINVTFAFTCAPYPVFILSPLFFRLFIHANCQVLRLHYYSLLIYYNCPYWM